jgi:M6 family metalloprotease-like protein
VSGEETHESRKQRPTTPRNEADSVDNKLAAGVGVSDGHGRRDVLKTLTAAVGMASVGPLPGKVQAVPVDESTNQEMHLGSQKVIFLGVYFQDSAPPGSIEEYDAALFDSDSELGANDYTLQEYFDIVSDGQFSISPGPNGLSGWYQLSMTTDEFHARGGLGPAAEEALERATNQGLDISPYGDQENDTQVVLIYYGGGGGGVAWPGHSLEHGGVRVNGVCKAAARPTADAQDINYSAHEYLHLHRLPDLYNEPGIGNMGLMGGGPLVDLTPWSKINVDFEQTPTKVGWDETPAIHPTDQAGILPPQSVENQFYTIIGEPNSAEQDPDFHKYYYLAYSDRSGVDSTYDPSQEGLIVWHHFQSMGVEFGAKNMQFDTPAADGSVFRASDSGLESSKLSTDVVLENVSTEYGSLQFNNPPKRSVSAGEYSAYAIEVTTKRPEWLPNLADREQQNNGDVIHTDDVLDARVSWADDTDDITLRLVDPQGTEHTVSDSHDTSFAVVRSEPVSGTTAYDGGWKLLENPQTDDTVDYYRATNYPTHELATRVDIDSTSLDGGDLTATVSIFFGDGADYTYGPFGAPDASQFGATVDGSPVDDSKITVTEIDESTYDVTASVESPGSGDHPVSITFADQKAGVSHRVSSPATTVTGAESGSNADGPSETDAGVEPTTDPSTETDTGRQDTDRIDTERKGTESQDTPGFGIGTALVSLGSGAYMLKRRLDSGDDG